MLKRIATCALVLALILTTAFTVTGCGKDNEQANNGTSWYTGNGAPSAATAGEDGDFFFDQADCSVYLKTNGAWTLLTSLAGKDGVDGVDGVNGEDGKDGADGEDGKDGVDGKTPYIGENGNWFIGDVDTGVKAEGVDGEDGKDGADGEDGKNGTNGKDGKDGVDGEDGKDGNDGADGEDGKDGADGKTPYIGENGNWFIGDVDTGVKAEGVDG
ncbi:MAG: collagen-like protein, partial [Clostridia bacterium]|nr:collagen-like protein [Clostridia bacterium]